MNKVTGIAVVNSAEGKRISYTYSVIDEETGNLVESNVKRSFIAVEDDLINIIKQLENVVKAKIN